MYYILKYYYGESMERAELLAGGVAVAVFSYFVFLFVKGPAIAVIISAIAYAGGAILASRTTQVQVFTPKAMFQGNVSYLSPNDGYRLLQAAMERSGMVKEERK